MHVYMMTRGIKHMTEKFISELAAKYLEATLTADGTNKPEKYSAQVQVRPIQLWEIVFPKEHRDVMLTTLFPGGQLMQHKKHKKWVWGLRKVLGVKAIPKTWDMSRKLTVDRQGLETVGIGIKDDYTREDGTEAL